jgi:hypothetical protein
MKSELPESLSCSTGNNFVAVRAVLEIEDCESGVSLPKAEQAYWRKKLPKIRSIVHRGESKLLTADYRFSIGKERTCEIKDESGVVARRCTWCSSVGFKGNHETIFR